MDVEASRRSRSAFNLTNRGARGDSLWRMPFVESVNVGHTVDVPWGQLKRTAIDKRPVEGPVHVHHYGVGHDVTCA